MYTADHCGPKNTVNGSAFFFICLFTTLASQSPSLSYSFGVSRHLTWCKLEKNKLSETSFWFTYNFSCGPYILVGVKAYFVFVCIIWFLTEICFSLKCEVYVGFMKLKWNRLDRFIFNLEMYRWHIKMFNW